MTTTASSPAINPWKEPNTMTIEENTTEDLLATGCLLDEKLKSAQIQIGENEKLKEQCLHQLREWISQNRDIEYIPIDDNFLIRFLRSKKYSLFLSQQMILKYMNLRKKFSQYAPDMDFQKTEVDELINTGFIFASPFRDSEGRRVIIYNIGKFDLHKFTNVDFGRLFTITYEAVMEDEETQLLGVNHVVDLSGMSAAFSTLFTITEFTRIIIWGEQSYPMSHKQINMLNVPTALRYIYDYAVSMMSKKLMQRFIIHTSKSSLLENVDKHCLPQEMGGVMPMSEMIKLWKEELKQKRNRLLSLEKIHLLSDQGIISRKNIAEHMNNAESQGICGSFRKLEVD
ncbi:alpha-tocopherol transfer protein-like [Harmonia axyridis]|uniref:alpha-tocopherol transfer protein-like n=1 Tax=Harmonia axyridis TaxID=115357 RepID=UPI001E277DFF|nr:alpha-tocopherol transfer protein-like [Harmonia axyridis]